MEKEKDALKNEINLLNMVRAYVEKTGWRVDASELNADFLSLVESQNLLAMLQYMLFENGISLPTEESQAKLRGVYMSSIALDHKQQLAKRKIEKVCKEKGVTYCFFKGADLKSLYGDNPEIRSMGDIDILLSDEDRRNVISTLTNGEIDKYEIEKDETGIDFEGVHIEFHKQIVYFDKLIVSVDDIADGTLNSTHYLFLLVTHIIKHIISSGCGIRQFMDVALFINKYGSQIDWQDFIAKLETTGKATPGLYIIAFCKNALGAKVPLDFGESKYGANNYDSNYSDNEYNEYIDNNIININIANACTENNLQPLPAKYSDICYDTQFESDFLSFIMSNGVFGFDDISVRGENVKIKNSNSRFPRLKTAWQYAFPSVKVLSNLYPKASTCSKICLPYYYVRNICRKIGLLFSKEKRGRAIFGSVMMSDANSSRKQLFDKLQIMKE